MLPVFYDPRMVARGQCSPSAAKPEAVMRSWRLLFPITEHPVTPATPDDLALAHSPEYVRNVLDCKRLNGFGSRDPRVSKSLLYTNGSMLTAARHVLTTGGVAASPTSGFHHAGYDMGGGFCTFNGLMVTAIAMQVAGLARRVAIIDCDAHYGDGTDEIITELELHDILHFTAGAHFWNPSDTPSFFASLQDMCERVNDDCDLVLYQAGADPHVNDPLGGFLTTQELRERDELVFSTVTQPLVWNLAGGYQEEPDGSIPKVLEIHDNTMRAWMRSMRWKETG